MSGDHVRGAGRLVGRVLSGVRPGAGTEPVIRQHLPGALDQVDITYLISTGHAGCHAINGFLNHFGNDGEVMEPTLHTLAYKQ